MCKACDRRAVWNLAHLQEELGDHMSLFALLLIRVPYSLKMNFPEWE